MASPDCYLTALNGKAILDQFGIPLKNVLKLVFLS
jgi:hypothetical protein